MSNKKKSESSFIQKQFSSQNFGTAFILLALFAGALGGIITMPFASTHISQNATTIHAFLMSFFVICPAFLGGLSQWLLPQMLKAKETALPSFLGLSWCLLALAIIFLPLKIELGMGFWCVGILPLAIHVIVNILEERRIHFREFSPFIWSSLLTSCAIIIISPVIFALILKNYSLPAFLPVLHIADILLMLVPALGLISLIAPAKSSSLFYKTAPYILAFIALLIPLLWSDYLFGGIDIITSDIFYHLLQNIIALSTIFYLILLCHAIWHDSVSFKATNSWSFATMISLAIGSLLSFYHGVHISHQLLIFGCLFSLFTGFYNWFEHILDQFQAILEKTTYKKSYFELWGFTHLIITLFGIFGTLIFPTFFIPLLLTACSILGFSIMGLFSIHLFFKSAFLEKENHLTSFHQNA